MKPAPLGGETRYELRNSLWMNAAHAVLYTFFASVFAFFLVAVLKTQTWRLVWVLPLLAASLWGAWRRWKRTFDRSVQVVIDETGILDKQSRFGQIRWSDITSAQFQYLRSQRSIVVTFKDVQPWLNQANWLARTVFSFRSDKPFFAVVSLTEMPYDRAALHDFVATKVGASSP